MQKRFAAFLLILSLCPVVISKANAQAVQPAQSADISGLWVATAIVMGEPRVGRFVFKVDGEKLTGTGLNGLSINGKLNGSQLEFGLWTPSGMPRATLKGTVENGEMRGTVVFNGQPGTWTAERPATRPADAPRVHTFEPKQFHRLFSGTIEPVLKIFPGDTVHTWSVDAGGTDHQSVRRSLGGNPQTGPFYIEGALPGDTLVVQLKRVRLNRDFAVSGSSIVGSALAPYYLQGIKEVPNFDSKWKLDRERGVATLANPTEKLKNFSITLRPMLGCVGVAPPRNQAFATGDLGPYGGNMDYNEVREGTTLYLPVFQTGALLFMGDGHAAQGDGELTGDALETSMEIEFAVDVIQGKSAGGPRAENDEYLMAFGIGGSLQEALQRATTGLAQWIESDYKLNAAEVAVVLGTSIRYDVAELVDPHIHVVAKIRKSALAQINKEGK
ncbi:MAG TPA: acetamidase/formamidase family protein [Blastocatellia bacterium]|nr:acetamidase/formamidase family protein [Blastocatellia bacterium]